MGVGKPGVVVHPREQERVGRVGVALVVDDEILLGHAVPER